MRTKKLISFISVILCVCIIFGTGVSARAETKVDNSDFTAYTESKKDFTVLGTMMYAIESAVGFVGSLFSSNQSDLNTSSRKSTIKTPFIITFLRPAPKFFSGVEAVLFIGTTVEITEIGSLFCKVEYGEKEGYVFNWWLSGGKGSNLSVNVEFDHVYVGKTNSNRIKAVYDGNGTVTWSTDNPKILKVNSSTGLVTGVSPGQANVIATVGNKSASVPVYCVYKWEKAWTGSANATTTIKCLPSSNSEDRYDLPKGTKFVVGGDDGFSGGWAYGNIQGTNNYGFVRIEKISTKGTVSQYNNLQWSWPVKTPEGKNKANYISSPYGERITTPTKHKGIDITTGTKGEISGYPIVSAFSGTVDYVCEKTSLDWGYCASIISDDEILDFVSGKQYVAIYMHMLKKPKVSRGQEVSQGKEIGYVGSTGQSNGYHLHFEVNNQTASIYESNGKEASQAGRSSYNDLINPIFFYMDDNLRYKEDSEAEVYYYGTYWYGSE